MRIPGISFELHEVYPELRAIEAEKDPTGRDHRCPRECKESGHLYRHDFRAQGIKVFQNSSGSILVITEI